MQIIEPQDLLALARTCRYLDITALSSNYRCEAIRQLRLANVQPRMHTQSIAKCASYLHTSAAHALFDQLNIRNVARRSPRKDGRGTRRALARATHISDSPLDSAQLNGSQLGYSQLDSSHLDGSQLDNSQLNEAECNSAQLDSLPLYAEPSAGRRARPQSGARTHTRNCQQPDSPLKARTATLQLGATLSGRGRARRHEPIATRLGWRAVNGRHAPQKGAAGPREPKHARATPTRASHARRRIDTRGRCRRGRVTPDGALTRGRATPPFSVHTLAASTRQTAS
jgi:uncharacterized protein YjbI with pentapeptide repeats